MCGRTPSTPRSGSGHDSGMAANRPESAQAKTATVRPVQSRAHGGSLSSTQSRSRAASGRPHRASAAVMVRRARAVGLTGGGTAG